MLNTSTTTPFDIDYPQDADSPDGPSQIGEVASAAALLAWAAGAEHKVSSISAGQTIDFSSYTVAGTPDRVSLKLKQNSTVEIGFRCNAFPDTTWNGTTRFGLSLYIDGNVLPGPDAADLATVELKTAPINGANHGFPVYTTPRGPVANGSTDAWGLDVGNEYDFGTELVRGGETISFLWTAADKTVNIEARYKRFGAASVKVTNRLLVARCMAPKP